VLKAMERQELSKVNGIALYLSYRSIGEFCDRFVLEGQQLEIF
jgi:hypothetical protein